MLNFSGNQGKNVLSSNLHHPKKKKKSLAPIVLGYSRQYMPHLGILFGGVSCQLTCKSLFSKEGLNARSYMGSCPESCGTLFTFGAPQPYSPLSKMSLWLMISPVGQKPISGGFSLTWPPQTPIVKQLLACFWAFLDSWHLNIWHMKAVWLQPSSPILCGGGGSELRLNNEQGGKDPTNFLAKWKWYQWYCEFTWKSDSYLFGRTIFSKIFSLFTDGSAKLKVDGTHWPILTLQPQY